MSPVYYNIQHKQRKRRFGPHLHNLSSSELAPVPPQNEKYTAQATVNRQRQTALGSSSFSPRWYLRVLELIMEYIQREHCTIASYVDHSQRYTNVCEFTITGNNDCKVLATVENFCSIWRCKLLIGCICPSPPFSRQEQLRPMHPLASFCTCPSS